MVKDAAAPARKKKYVCPTLRSHGTLRSLTQGPGGSAKADGMSGMSMDS
jgi:hypothetical protein